MLHTHSSKYLGAVGLYNVQEVLVAHGHGPPNCFCPCYPPGIRVYYCFLPTIFPLWAKKLTPYIFRIFDIVGG